MDKLSRRPNESELDYHKRLVYGKLVDGTLSDEDYSELATYVYGKEYSTDVARRMMYGSCRTLKLMDSQIKERITNKDMLTELEEQKIEIQKERQKFYDYRNAFNKVVRERARQEELNEIIKNEIANGSLPSLSYSPKENTYINNNNCLLVSLNDIHYGAVIDNYWCQYNSDICKQMFCNYLDEIINIQQLHNCERCVVWCNGDAISGSIHHSIAVTNKENIIAQIMGVSELISEFLSELSKHFLIIDFVSVAGNHSRLDTKERALKDERLDDLVEWYVSARLQNFENIHIGNCDKIDNTMYVIDICGKTYCGVHGDYDGSAAKIQALQTMAGRPIYAVLLGHLHHNKVDTVQGIKTIMSGSFLGMDDYCVSKRIYGTPQQLVCVCDTNGIKCSYDINLR